MTFQFASDLHLEHRDNAEWLKKYPLEPKADILLLAGDIFNLADVELPVAKHFLDLWADQFKQVYMIPGNHEFYGRLFPIENVFPSFKMACRPNVTYLNNEVVITDQVRFIFTTLFSHIPDNEKWIIEDHIADFHNCRYAKDSYLNLTVAEYNHCFETSKAFLEATLDTPFKGKTVVITHHVPYPKKYIVDYPWFQMDLSAAFHSDLVRLFHRYEIDHWISGHTHINHDPIKIGDTWCHTNQLGYIGYDDLLEFDGGKTIEI